MCGQIFSDKELHEEEENSCWRLEDSLIATGFEKFGEGGRVVRLKGVGVRMREGFQELMR